MVFDVHQRRIPECTGELTGEVPMLVPQILEQVVEVVNVRSLEHIAECFFRIGQETAGDGVNHSSRVLCNVLWRSLSFMADFAIVPHDRISEKFCEQTVNVPCFWGHFSKCPRFLLQPTF